MGMEKELSVADVSYIQKNIGHIIAHCLVDVVEERPLDPIDFMARWLYHHASTRLYFENRVKLVREMGRYAEETQKKSLERWRRLAVMKSQIGKYNFLLRHSSRIPDTWFGKTDGSEAFKTRREDSFDIYGQPDSRRGSKRSVPEQQSDLFDLETKLRRSTSLSSETSSRFGGRRPHYDTPSPMSLIFDMMSTTSSTFVYKKFGGKRAKGDKDADDDARGARLLDVIDAQEEEAEEREDTKTHKRIPQQKKWKGIKSTVLYGIQATNIMREKRKAMQEAAKREADAAREEAIRAAKSAARRSWAYSGQGSTLSSLTVSSTTDSTLTSQRSSVSHRTRHSSVKGRSFKSSTVPSQGLVREDIFGELAEPDPEGAEDAAAADAERGRRETETEGWFRHGSYKSIGPHLGDGSDQFVAALADISAMPLVEEGEMWHSDSSGKGSDDSSVPHKGGKKKHGTKKTKQVQQGKKKKRHRKDIPDTSSSFAGRHSDSEDDDSHRDSSRQDDLESIRRSSKADRGARVRGHSKKFLTQAEASAQFRESYGEYANVNLPAFVMVDKDQIKKEKRKMEERTQRLERAKLRAIQHRLSIDNGGYTQGRDASAPDADVEDVLDIEAFMSTENVADSEHRLGASALHLVRPSDIELPAYLLDLEDNVGVGSVSRSSSGGSSDHSATQSDKKGRESKAARRSRTQKTPQYKLQADTTHMFPRAGSIPSVEPSTLSGESSDEKTHVPTKKHDLMKVGYKRAPKAAKDMSPSSSITESMMDYTTDEDMDYEKEAEEDVEVETRKKQLRAKKLPSITPAKGKGSISGPRADSKSPKAAATPKKKKQQQKKAGSKSSKDTDEMEDLSDLDPSETYSESSTKDSSVMSEVLAKEREKEKEVLKGTTKRVKQDVKFKAKRGEAPPASVPEEKDKERRHSSKHKHVKRIHLEKGRAKEPAELRRKMERKDDQYRGTSEDWDMDIKNLELLGEDSEEYTDYEEGYVESDDSDLSGDETEERPPREKVKKRVKKGDASNVLQVESDRAGLSRRPSQEIAGRRHVKRRKEGHADQESPEDDGETAKERTKTGASGFLDADIDHPSVSRRPSREIVGRRRSKKLKDEHVGGDDEDALQDRRKTASELLDVDVDRSEPSLSRRPSRETTLRRRKSKHKEEHLDHESPAHEGEDLQEKWKTDTSDLTEEDIRERRKLDASNLLDVDYDQPSQSRRGSHDFGGRRRLKKPREQGGRSQQPSRAQSDESIQDEAETRRKQQERAEKRGKPKEKAPSRVESKTSESSEEKDTSSTESSESGKDQEENGFSELATTPTPTSQSDKIKNLESQKLRRKSEGKRVSKLRTHDMAVWELHQCRLVCNHPKLGKLGEIKHIRAEQSVEEWGRHNFSCHVLLDQEIYTRCDVEFLEPEIIIEKTESQPDHAESPASSTASSKSKSVSKHPQSPHLPRASMGKPGPKAKKHADPKKK